jgi:hypothetical protein
VHCDLSLAQCAGRASGAGKIAQILVGTARSGSGDLC